MGIEEEFDKYLIKLISPKQCFGCNTVIPAEFVMYVASQDFLKYECCFQYYCPVCIVTIQYIHMFNSSVIFKRGDLVNWSAWEVSSRLCQFYIKEKELWPLKCNLMLPIQEENAA